MEAIVTGRVLNLLGKFPSDAKFNVFTYKSLLRVIFRNRGLRVESEYTPVQRRRDSAVQRQKLTGARC
jgi:hypothetical protein